MGFWYISYLNNTFCLTVDSQLGESEWNRMSEKERQRHIFQLKLRERQLRKAGNVDEANALIGELGFCSILLVSRVSLVNRAQAFETGGLGFETHREWKKIVIIDKYYCTWSLHLINWSLHLIICPWYLTPVRIQSVVAEIKRLVLVNPKTVNLRWLDYSDMALLLQHQHFFLLLTRGVVT